MQRSLGLFHATESYLSLLQEAPLRDHLLWQQETNPLLIEGEDINSLLDPNQATGAGI